MSNLTRESFNVLPEFQRFLQERKLMKEKNAPYFAYRVSRFLTFARQRDIASDKYQETAVIEFLEMLQADKKVVDWQHRQADEAIRLYYFPFLGKSSKQLSGTMLCADVSAVLAEIKRVQGPER
jgi:hypothetical protein